MALASPDYSRGFSVEWIWLRIGVGGLRAQSGIAAGGFVFLVGVRGWLDFFLSGVCQENSNARSVRLLTVVN